MGKGLVSKLGKTRPHPRSLLYKMAPFNPSFYSTFIKHQLSNDAYSMNLIPKDLTLVEETDK